MFSRFIELFNVWLIKGSKWQPGILTILRELGPEGQSIANQLDKITRSYDQFETSRIPNDAKNLRSLIVDAVQQWKAKKLAK